MGVSSSLFRYSGLLTFLFGTAITPAETHMYGRAANGAPTRISAHLAPPRQPARPAQALSLRRYVASQLRGAHDGGVRAGRERGRIGRARVRPRQRRGACEAQRSGEREGEERKSEDETGRTSWKMLWATRRRKGRGGGRCELGLYTKGGRTRWAAWDVLEGSAEGSADGSG